MARTETRFGVAKAVSTTYVNVATIPGATTANGLLHICALAACTIRAYIAAASWTTGEPTGADLVETLAYDMPFIAGEVSQISGFIVNTGEKVIVRASTGSADIGLHGVAIT